MRDVKITTVAEEYVLRALASVTPQPIVLSKHTPRRIGEVTGRLGFTWYYEKVAATYASAIWGILCERELAFEEVLDLLRGLRRHIAEGGWVIVTVDEAHDVERWSSGLDRRHPDLASYGFALAADVEVKSNVLTTIVRSVPPEMDPR